MKFGAPKQVFKLNTKRVQDVEPIRNGFTGVVVEKKEDLEDLVEEPCLKTCQQLFDKNVQTIDSGCNKENSSHRAYIVINYDTLNDANKRIADDMVQRGAVRFSPKDDECPSRNGTNQITIEVATKPSDLVSLVERKLLNITKEFQKQPNIHKTISHETLKWLAEYNQNR
ncbi:MAG: hypothetical protein R3Y43_06110 [Alphaproteobacteria bacterium]